MIATPISNLLTKQRPPRPPFGRPISPHQTSGRSTAPRQEPYNDFEAKMAEKNNISNIPLSPARLQRTAHLRQPLQEAASHSPNRRSLPREIRPLSARYPPLPASSRRKPGGSPSPEPRRTALTSVPLPTRFCGCSVSAAAHPPCAAPAPPGHLALPRTACVCLTGIQDVRCSAPNATLRRLSVYFW